jgi:hypothetical protein
MNKPASMPIPAQGGGQPNMLVGGVVVPQRQAIFPAVLEMMQVAAGFVTAGLIAWWWFPTDFWQWFAIVATAAIPTTFVQVAKRGWYEAVDDSMSLFHEALDRNGNGIPDDLEEMLREIYAEIKNRPARSTLVVTFHKSPNETWNGLLPALHLVEFAKGVLDGRDLTYAEWVGDEPGKPFKQGEYDRLITAMIREGYAEKVNPRARNSPVAPTPEGISILEDIVANAPRIASETGQA